MLIGINGLLTPDMLWVLSSMGHGDEIAIVDANYPAVSGSANSRLVMAPTADSIAAVLAILEVMPIDEDYNKNPLAYISKGTRKPHKGVATEFLAAVDGFLVNAPPTKNQPEALPKADFYKRASMAFAIVATNDPRHWACFILRKGVLPDPTAS